MRVPMIYFEDLEIGKSAVFGTYDVTREEVLEFAQKYDPQPFHLSDEEAAKTHFGRIAASGWHTAAMVMAVIARRVVDEKQAGLGSPGIDELRWKKPVYPGDTLAVDIWRGGDGLARFRARVTERDAVVLSHGRIGVH